ncbi:SH3 domain-containing protein [Marinospirillum celere]|uniref:SH3 domain-containing protein n=1 Tax=Marinospirillum celere TaxID=1122252 RepID=UPI000B831DD4|nr:SH3 domain-containing protein [Marinospirillum celere]
MKKQLLSTLLLLMMASVLQAETLYISSHQAKVMREPAFQAEVVVELQRAEAIEVTDRQGAWLAIALPNGETGWVA